MLKIPGKIALKSNMITDLYRGSVFLSRYSRNIDGRLENPKQTVDRYVDNLLKPYDKIIPVDSIRESMINFRVFPSMRALLTAGPALKENPVAGYNCSYLTVSNPKAFPEMLYLLMSGTGVGFSVERKYVSQLPQIPNLTNRSIRILFPDTREGCVRGYEEVIYCLYHGVIPSIDLSKIRPQGSPLKTFGGRAMGPEAFDDLIKFTIDKFTKAQGRQLTPLECHDLCCKIADITICGGVRRSALISLSDLDDQEMAVAKSGEWYLQHPYRALANNSAVYHDINQERFFQEWNLIKQSGSGERGFFSRNNCRQIIENNAKNRNPNFEAGTNPCSEIILRDMQMCNLSELVVAPYTDHQTWMTEMKKRVEYATILGTIQSTYDNFSYLRPEWAHNARNERLLGVSMTGICDVAFTSTPSKQLEQSLKQLSDWSVEVNEKLAAKIGIKPSAAITCIKPSGTVAQIAHCSPGIHPRFGKYYLRRVRYQRDCDIAKFLIQQGVPHEPAAYDPRTVIFSFPLSASDQSLTTKEVDAISQLELYKLYSQHWCQHKVSMTTYIENDQWDQVGQWIYQNRDVISGVAFLPKTDNTYVQAPYEEITLQQYITEVEKFPANVNINHFTGGSDGSQVNELACSAGGCDL